MRGYVRPLVGPLQFRFSVFYERLMPCIMSFDISNNEDVNDIILLHVVRISSVNDALTVYDVKYSFSSLNSDLRDCRYQFSIFAKS